MELIEHTAGRVPGPGLYRMPAAVYHADPAPGPSMSSSLIPIMLWQSPKHVAMAHPRLGRPPEETEPDEDETDVKPDKVNIGSVAHELLLGHGGGMHVIETRGAKTGKPVTDFRTKDAQEEREWAIGAGLTPILPHHLLRAERIAHAVRRALAEIPGAERVLDPEHTQAEVVGVFRHEASGIWGRFMLDNWGPDPTLIWDVKSTEAALTDRFIRTQIETGLAARACWYMQGLAALWPELAGRLRYRFVFVEQKRPHEVRVIELEPTQFDMGNRQAVAAAVSFGHYLDQGTWPGYPRKIDMVPSKPWFEADWLAQEQTMLEGSIGTKFMMALSPARTEAAREVA